MANWWRGTVDFYLANEPNITWQEIDYILIY
jgi:hypothetical protein